MARGFFREKNIRRARSLLDLPTDVVDASGQVIKALFEQYTRTLAEWARDIAFQVEGRSVVRREYWDANSSGYTGTTITDMFALDVQLTAGWFYGVHLNSPVSFPQAGGRALLAGTANAQNIGRFDDIDGDIVNYVADGWLFFVPPIQGLYDIGVSVQNGGAGTLTLAADADTHRSLTIVGFGPTPPEFVP